jgi:SPFH domain / Band 7 family
MNFAGWMIFVAIVVPVVGILVYFLADDALIRVDPGKLGLLVVRGRATNKTLQPGPHFVPAFRRMTVEEYPSLELSFRAGDFDASGDDVSDIQHTSPAVRATLGDGAEASIAFTLRFRLDPLALRAIHERFGQDGIWVAIRDLSTSAVRSAVADPDVGLDNLRPPERTNLGEKLQESIGVAIRGAGFEMTLFSLGNADLGVADELVQATVRARLELEREEAEAPVRLARARHDAELQPFVTGDASGVALRYRENEVWRDVARLMAAERQLVMHAPTRQLATEITESTRSEPDDSDAAAEESEE